MAAVNNNSNVTNISNVYSSTANKAAGSVTNPADAGSQDRFLKLLVTQLKNQDPLSPMDNAQLTSQIAQINTVTGIATLNTSVQTLSTQFLQMQSLQGATLLGKDVIVAGNRLDIDEGVAQGGFELTAAADAVKVEIVSPAGKVIDTMNLGAQRTGMHSFDWPSGTFDASAKLTFRVTATSGANTLSSTALMRDKVTAVSTQGNDLVLELESGATVAYTSVKAIN